MVTLFGRVDCLAEEPVAVDVAERAKGVRKVVSALKIGQIEPTTEPVPIVDASTVAVHVSGHGEVMMSGTVRSPEQRRTAENDTWCVLSVRNVTNYLSVVPLGA